MRSLAPALGLLLIAVFAAPQARALALCQDDESGRVGHSERLETVAAPDLVETIVPCALLESGAQGPWCLDASVYVLTPTGVLLCRAGLVALDLPDLEGVALSRAPPPPGSTVPAGADALAFPGALGPALPAPLYELSPRALAEDPRPDRPGAHEPPLQPG